MKIKKNQKRYCSICLVHTDHEIKKVSKGKPSKLSWIARQKKRRGNTGNIGKFKKSLIKSNKVSKRPFVLSICSTCDRKRPVSYKRAKKWSIEL